MIIAPSVIVIIFFNLKQQEHTSLSERSDKRKLAQLVLLPTDSWSNEVLKRRINPLAGYLQF